ncbi:hypothetical protein [Ancylomarina longa]|uniref:DUF4412 domain-containing protein n=1 Tax=Ancylomarina longa TaxID=2487017 RepID=A0A434AXH5_9BACT|nr:hypothetical protein [Ancylomarina longa]RUT79229.1 hypothetical protein DLK05_05275 [Ancylomarina longa]
MKKALFIILLSVILGGCKKQNQTNNTLKEGIITYEVSYFTSEKDNPIIALLPNKVELRFKNNNICLISEGYLGFFSTKFISNYKENHSNILLKVLNNKFNYEFPKDEIAFIYNRKAPSHIEYSDSTKMIAGYKCKMATLFHQDKTINPIKIFYTLEIGLDKPNRNTPLNMLSGVLMQFETSMNNVKTKFTAIQVNHVNVAEEDFQIPTNYVKADMETLKKYIVDFN